VAAAFFGLVLSSIARSNEQIMPMFVRGVADAATDRIFLDQLSWTMPSRWGYAASASTIDLWKLVPGTLSPKDSHWKHTPAAWLFDTGMIGVLSFVYAVVVRWRIRLRR
jgi:ABC transport system ATP-binding/permease protein